MENIMARIRIKFVSKKLTELSVLYGLYSIDWDYSMVPCGLESLLSHFKLTEIWTLWVEAVKN